MKPSPRGSKTTEGDSPPHSSSRPAASRDDDHFLRAEVGQPVAVLPFSVCAQTTAPIGLDKRHDHAPHPAARPEHEDAILGLHLRHLFYDLQAVAPARPTVAACLSSTPSGTSVSARERLPEAQTPSLLGRRPRRA